VAAAVWLLLPAAQPATRPASRQARGTGRTRRATKKAARPARQPPATRRGMTPRRQQRWLRRRPRCAAHPPTLPAAHPPFQLHLTATSHTLPLVRLVHLGLYLHLASWPDCNFFMLTGTMPWWTGIVNAPPVQHVHVSVTTPPKPKPKPKPMELPYPGVSVALVQCSVLPQCADFPARPQVGKLAPKRLFV
jgi:hypothetical protein